MLFSGYLFSESLGLCFRSYQKQPMFLVILVKITLFLGKSDCLKTL